MGSTDAVPALSRALRRCKRVMNWSICVCFVTGIMAAGLGRAAGGSGASLVWLAGIPFALAAAAFVVFGAATVVALGVQVRLRHLLHLHQGRLCPGCGYSMNGDVRLCPECGRAWRGDEEWADEYAVALPLDKETKDGLK